ncbi:MAG: ATP-binding protein [Bacteroidales bacterium]
MKYLERTILQKILQSLVPNKVFVIQGARRTGKTVLIKQLLEKINEPYFLLNGEDFSVQEILQRKSVQNYKNFLGTKKLLIIDEAQNIPEIGARAKLMIDEIPGLKIILTGSSSFDLSNKTGEPLTGRKTTFFLYPFSENELNQEENFIQKRDNLRQRMICGNYPELVHVNGNAQKQEYLNEIVNAYLLKDILIHENIKNSSKIINLLRLVAFQVGSQVSMQELGKKLAMSKNTVEKYLDLLSKVFVLFKVEGFSRNLRKEITKTAKWYFYDNGIRNALIANFNNLGMRNDTGMLWENYMISERIKFLGNNRIISNNYFWRTYDKQEIDWIEERGGQLTGYELKWNTNTGKSPAAWQSTYPDAEFEVIHPENYMEWLS